VPGVSLRSSRERKVEHSRGGKSSLYNRESDMPVAITQRLKVMFIQFSSN